MMDLISTPFKISKLYGSGVLLGSCSAKESVGTVLTALQEATAALISQKCLAGIYWRPLLYLVTATEMPILLYGALGQ